MITASVPFKSRNANNSIAYSFIFKRSKQSHTTVAMLMSLNPQIKRPDWITVGETIRIR